MAASGLIEEMPPLSPEVFRRLAWRDLRRSLGAGATRVARAAQVRAERAVVELSGRDLQKMLDDLAIVDTGPIDD